MPDKLDKFMTVMMTFFKRFALIGLVFVTVMIVIAVVVQLLQKLFVF
jgi:hypothetical protein